jgi:prepilin-type N-terminal cleavage/methylation domain-containing protein
MTHERRTEAGFTLIEVVTVCAIIGILALLAYPNMVRFNAQQQAKSGATQMAGVLDEARSRATNEATPYLVYINEKIVDGGGGCGPAATIVRDSDRTYTVTAGDDVRDVALAEGACAKVKQFGETPTAGLDDVRLPVEDLSVRALVSTGVATVAGEEDDDEDDEGSSGGESTDSGTRVMDVAVNGATFPIDANSGRPVIAFSERGIPVDPANPTSWGSGAGAVYMTDGHSTVYAAVVEPLGNVQLRVYDSVKGDWR